PGPVRFAGFAISYNVSTALFGGTAPSANEAIIGATGNTIVPAYFIMGACLIGFIAALFMKETNGASLRGAGLPATGADIVFDEAALSGTKCPRRPAPRDRFRRHRMTARRQDRLCDLTAAPLHPRAALERSTASWGSSAPRGGSDGRMCRSRPCRAY